MVPPNVSVPSTSTGLVGSVTVMACDSAAFSCRAVITVVTAMTTQTFFLGVVENGSG
jgi:hypothetical protein